MNPAIITQQPSTWFATEGNTKPRIAVYVDPNRKDLMDGLRFTLYNAVTSGSQIDYKIALSYIYQLYKTRQESLPEEWKTYNQIIGLKNSIVTPWSLLEVDEVVEDAVTAAAISNGAVLDGIDNWLPMVILSVFRISSNNMRYDNDQVEHIKAASKKEGRPVEAAINLLDFASLNRQWSKSGPLRIAAAALDMFYFRFPHSKHSSIRVSTCTTRYKECATLNSVVDMCKKVNMNVRDLKYFIFSPDAIKNIKRMSLSEGNDEWDKEFSYFPYQVSMGLVNRSSYSSTACESLYFIASCVMSFHGDIRGHNARNFLSIGLPDNLRNAQIIAYIFSDRDTVVDCGENNGGFLGTLPSGRDPEEWRDYLTLNDYRLHPKIMKYVQKRCSLIKGTRPRSIGEFLSRHGI